MEGRGVDGGNCLECLVVFAATGMVKEGMKTVTGRWLGLGGERSGAKGCPLQLTSDGNWIGTKRTSTLAWGAHVSKKKPLKFSFGTGVDGPEGP